MEGVKVKDRFLRILLRNLCKRPLTEKRVKDAIYDAWENGASHALFLSACAYSEVGEQRRVAYARMFLGLIALNDYNHLYGEDPSKEHLARIIDNHIKMEQVVPFVTLTPELTLISEERSRN